MCVCVCVCACWLCTRVCVGVVARVCVCVRVCWRNKVRAPSPSLFRSREPLRVPSGRSVSRFEGCGAVIARAGPVCDGGGGMRELGTWEGCVCECAGACAKWCPCVQGLCDGACVRVIACVCVAQVPGKAQGLASPPTPMPPHLPTPEAWAWPASCEGRSGARVAARSAGRGGRPIGGDMSNQGDKRGDVAHRHTPQNFVWLAANREGTICSLDSISLFSHNYFKQRVPVCQASGAMTRPELTSAVPPAPIPHTVTRTYTQTQTHASTHLRARHRTHTQTHTHALTTKQGHTIAPTNTHTHSALSHTRTHTHTHTDQRTFAHAITHTHTHAQLRMGTPWGRRLPNLCDGAWRWCVCA